MTDTTTIEVTETLQDKVVNRLRDLQIGERQEAYPIDPRVIIVEDGFNPRDFSTPENQVKLLELKDSIKAQGVQQPLWVRLEGAKGEKKVYLVDGERRLRATLMAIAEGADISTVPVIQKTLGINSAADRLVLALTANEGFPLSQMEVGNTYIRLAKYGWSNSQIAEKVGKSERFVREAIAIADAPDAVKELVKTGEVSQSLAIKTVKEDGADTAYEKLKAAVATAKAEGKTQAKAPKVDKKLTKLQQIQDVMDEYEALEESEITESKLIGFLADIADILEGAEVFSAPKGKKAA